MTPEAQLKKIRKQSKERVEKYRKRARVKALSTYIPINLSENLDSYVKNTGRKKKEVIETAIRVYISKPQQLDIYRIRKDSRCTDCQGYGCKNCNNTGWKD